MGSRTRTVAALKVFFRFCVENEYLDRNPALVLRTPKKREALPDVLDLVGAAPALSAVGASVASRAVEGESGRR